MDHEKLTDYSSIAPDVSFRVNRLPRATYRLQLNDQFGFEQVKSLIQYLDQLGISDLYLSPLFLSRAESEHGYDVVDQGRIEPSFGDWEGFRAMVDVARKWNMGVLLDIVPNHMGINDPGNLQWNDVLENGARARSAIYFDIEWDPANGSMKDKVLLPFLGKTFGECLESAELQVLFNGKGFSLAYFNKRFPISPPSWPLILEKVISNYSAARTQSMAAGSDANASSSQTDDADLLELKSICHQLSQLSKAQGQDTLSMDVFYREQAIASNRLAALVKIAPGFQDAIHRVLDRFNGQASENDDWQPLEELLDQQHYRLAYWRVAADEINYRRFFDINDLAAIRVEIKEVFHTVHQLTFRLLGEGLVTGLRIDHPDGLLDPLGYFQELQSTYRKCFAATDNQDARDSMQDSQKDVLPLFIVAEKILTGDEQLPTNWPISGTTGYEFLNRIAGILVDDDGVKQIQKQYGKLSGVLESPRDIVYQSKKTILQESMSSELSMLVSQLFRLAKSSRMSRDFTRSMLQKALLEWIACFQVYRTYTRPFGWEVDAEAHRRIMEAMRLAKRRNPTLPRSVFDYLTSILLLEFPASMEDSLKTGWRRWAVRLQQVTGPVTAKGIEDTSFYRYFPLASLNEVGAELGATGASLEHFHAWMQLRSSDWPHALSATATHDTKRGEDFRCRLHVLSEIPEIWESSVIQFNRLCEPWLIEVDGEMTPSRNERYFIYQTLIGTWPLATQSGQEEHDWSEYQRRIQTYTQKALREAKLQTSWTNPSEFYEDAVSAFIQKIIEQRNGEVGVQIDRLARQIAPAGYMNGLTQSVLKCTLPGTPDFYQGSEYWDFRLVDPDNRRPVDFDKRAETLQSLQERFHIDPSSLLSTLTQSWSDSFKQFVTWRLLQTRRKWQNIFSAGDYQPLNMHGSMADHLICFMRQYQQQTMIVIVPRHVFDLSQVSLHRDSSDLVMASPMELLGSRWGGTYLELPDGMPSLWEDQICLNKREFVDSAISVDQLFEQLPFAILIHA